MHRGKQIYDKQLLHLLTPQTAGPGGYWSEFDWDKACRLGSQATGLPYSGEYGFVARRKCTGPCRTWCSRSRKRLQCSECHGEQGVLDWQALGYEGDPAFRGDRWRLELVRGTKGESR